MAVVLFFIFSCSGIVSKGVPKESKQQYSYVDGSGKLLLTREHKLLKNKLITRTQISANEGSSLKPLEKSIMVSHHGTIKQNKSRIMVMRPFASEFTVWLEGKRYDSKMRLDAQSKSMQVELDSPEEKWKGKSNVPVPKGKQFCFFSQIPDCLYHNLLLTKAMSHKNEKVSFYVVWEGYPYVQDQFSGVGSNLFVPAKLRYDGEDKGIRRFSVHVEGQSIIYHFSKNFDFVRMFWIDQGITIVPPSEETADIDE